MPQREAVLTSIPRPANERPSLADVTARAVRHGYLGMFSTERDELVGSELATWERLHDVSLNRISPAELERQIGIFRRLGRRARQGLNNAEQSYLLGVGDGLIDSAARATYPIRALHSSPNLMELFTGAEVSVILTAHGLSSFDKAPKDLPYCLGRLMAIAYASGRTTAIPSTIPPVPTHLK